MIGWGNGRKEYGSCIREVCASLVCTFAAIILLAGPLRGQSDWEPLFNGKDFTGWRGQSDLWSIEDGVIVGRTERNLPLNEFLFTVKKYRNFIFRLKVRLVKNEGNSGIQFRSEYHDGAVRGYQADATEGWWGLLYEEGGRRILFKPDQEKVKVNRDGWNEYEILADGDHLQIRVNGEVTADIRDTQTAEGIFALQVHRGPPMEVRFKDLMIKELD